jgi:hypothetical protein
LVAVEGAVVASGEAVTTGVSVGALQARMLAASAIPANAIDASRFSI